MLVKRLLTQQKKFFMNVSHPIFVLSKQKAEDITVPRYYNLQVIDSEKFSLLYNVVLSYPLYV